MHGALELTRDHIVDITDHSYGINTAESYAPFAYRVGRDVLIPYVALYIIKPLVLGNLQAPLCIERSYLILSGCSRLCWHGSSSEQRTIIGERVWDSSCSGSRTDWYGIQGSDFGFELKAEFRKAFLLVPEDSLIQHGAAIGAFIAWDTPNFRKNMPDSDAFFELVSPPRELAGQLKDHPPVRMEFIPSAAHEVKRIQAEWGQRFSP